MLLDWRAEKASTVRADEAFAAGLVVFVTARDTGPLARLRAWALRRRLAALGGVRLLVLQTPRPSHRATQVVPQWWGDMARERR
jgi:hypothetical protein